MSSRRDFIKKTALLSGSAFISSSATIQDEVDGYDYDRPAFKKGTRILFQGDSITDMNRGRDESDRNHYLGHSYVYLIASRLHADLPETEMEFFNRGVSGHTVSDLKNRWKQDTIDLNPDLLSILVGTNDVYFGNTKEQFEEDYRFILKQSKEANPELDLVLMEPFVLQSGVLSEEGVYKERRAMTDELRMKTAELAREFDALFVPLQQIFDEAAEAVSPEHWVWDGIHPLPQGHELIARNWIEYVSKRWRR
ncbi:MAG TPA: lysophospholipase [Balneolaceae bacterium]|nr:lysophospholipase [Balneolaceae bacterium]|tara:strand:- start:102158 stop:102913 length:756 start_codon:yes stop_codon:yes gene_type:complete